MTRIYAPNPSQQVLDPLTGNALTGRSVTFWTAATSGTQITGLLDMTGAALPGSVATTDTYGLFGFQDPANTTAVYADAGYERVLLQPTDVKDRLTNVEASAATNATNVAAINTAKGAGNGFASLDSSARLPAAQLPVGTYRTSWFSVLDYGAKGDGTTDDTTAIQNALTAAGAFASSSSLGGFVYFPSASYKITSALNVPNNVTVSGAGPANTIIVATPSAAISAISVTPSGPGFPTNIIIERIGFQSSATSGTAAGISIVSTGSLVSSSIVMRDVNVKFFRGDQVYIRNPQNCVLTDVQTTGISGSGWGINLDGFTGTGPASLYSCISLSNTTGAFRLFGIQSGVIEACQGQSSPIGFKIDTCKTVTLMGCSTNACTTNGINIAAGFGAAVQSYVSFGDCAAGGDIISLDSTSTQITINSAIQGSVSGTPTSFIKTVAGANVLIQQCFNTTANNIAANTQVSAGVKMFSAAATGNPQTGIGATTTDIAGCTVTFSTVGTNTQCFVVGVVNASIGTGAAGVVNLYCNVDGTDQTLTGQTNLITTSSQLDVSQSWPITLAASGSHTIKLRAKNASGQTVNFNNNGNTSNITVLQLTA